MPGRLIYLMGPSGAGKDSLLNAVRGRLAGQRCRIVQRVITRSAEAVGEDARAVSVEVFEQMQFAGDFAMSWRANGLAYGIPREIEQWLEAGQHVLINGSRSYLAEVRQRYPALLAILLTVDADILRARLLGRGRETLAEIDARLARHAALTVAQAGKQCSGIVCLDNSGELEVAAQCFLELIESCG